MAMATRLEYTENLRSEMCAGQASVSVAEGVHHTLACRMRDGGIRGEQHE